MARNPERRKLLMDAGLEVLAREGSRGLTHRAVDKALGLPVGTCVNYFRSRDALYQALGEQIFERLMPSEVALAESANKKPSRKRVVELMEELMQRVMAQPALQIALLELRLESTRRPELRAALTKTLQKALEVDVLFHEQAGLPGGRKEVIHLHLAFEGLILNSITLPDVLGVAGKKEIIRELVEGVMPKKDTK